MTRDARTSEDALEPALRAILDDTGAAAGAISVFDERDASLRLVAEVGLAEEGCRRLDAAGQGDPGAWDLPLRTVRTGRAHVVVAREDGELPHLVQATTPVHALACVPLRVEPSRPVGSLVLVTLGLRSLTERDIEQLSEPLKALARLVDVVRERTTRRSPPLAVAADTRSPLPEASVTTDALPPRPTHIELLIASLAATERERGRLAAALETSTREQTARAVEWAVQVERLHARIDQAEAALVHARDSLHFSELRCERLQGEVDELRAHQAELGAQLLRRERPPLNEGSAAGADPRHPADAPAAAAESAPTIPQGPCDPPAAGGEATPRSEGPVTVLLDVDREWKAAGVTRHEVRVMPPGGDLARRLAAIGAGHIVANLAAPGVFEALAALREGGCTVPIRGCIGVRGGECAIPLGVVEVVARSGDPAAILSVLGLHMRRGDRIMTVGGDIDLFMGVRQGLRDHGVSVSMAWDGHQAADLLTLVRPTIVVVDLSLPGATGHATVARLGAVQPVPTAIMVRGLEDPAASFASAAVAAGIVELGVPLGELLAAAAPSGAEITTEPK